MKPLNKVGFTIIETMLFLGITGLLILGVLAGTSNSINTQRYRDSITSLQAFFQQQFSDASNVSNDNAGDQACYGNSAQARGQSNCVILGKYITIGNNGRTLSIKTAIGLIPLIQSVSTDDVKALKDYSISISSMANDSYDIAWGASIVKPVLFSILIVRSPYSGVLRTFIDPNSVVPDSNIKNLVNATALGSSLNACVDSNGMFNGNIMSVLITAGATGASGVETKGENSGC